MRSASDNVAVTRTGQAVVGPYSAVLVGSGPSDPGFLAWLGANHYVVPASIATVIGEYEARHFDFIALRLRPQVGVRAMQPIRITLAGYAPTLPLRMVRAGIADQVGLTLLVLANGPIDAANFPNVAFPESELELGWSTMRSNYRELFARTLADGGSRGWILETAGPVSMGLMGSLSDSGATGSIVLQRGGTSDAGAVDPDLLGSPDASTDASIDGTASGDSAVTLDATDAAPEASAPVMARADPYADRRIAFAGLGTSATVTRRRSQLTAAARSADLRLRASTAVIPSLARPSTRSINVPCPDAGVVADAGSARADAGATAPRTPPAFVGCAARATGARGGALAAIVALSGLALARRRRKRSKARSSGRVH